MGHDRGGVVGAIEVGLEVGLEIGFLALPVRVVPVAGGRTAALEQAGPHPTVENARRQGDIAGSADGVPLIDEHRH